MKKSALIILFSYLLLNACASTTATSPTFVVETTDTATQTPTETAQLIPTATPTPVMFYGAHFLVVFYDMAILPNQEVWAVGDHGIIVHDYVQSYNLVESFAYIGDYGFGGDGFLNSVDFISPDDGWLTGWGGQIFHWNGKEWTAIIPFDRNFITSWTDIKFASTNDGWVIGCNYDEYSGFIMHWDGNKWSDVSLINEIGRNNFCLYSLDVVSSVDVWAVGNDFKEGTILHWDGKKWNELPSSQNMRYVVDISALSNSDVWVAQADGSLDSTIFHWDGSAWDDTYLPISFSLGNTAKGVSILAISPNDVWAGGRGLFHWDGKEWKDSHYDAKYGFIIDIEKLSDGTIWAMTHTGVTLRLFKDDNK